VTESALRAVLDHFMESDLSEHEIITIFRAFRSIPHPSKVGLSRIIK
jgi:hypothetical protein